MIRLGIQIQPGPPDQVSVRADFVVKLLGDGGPLNVDTDVVLDINGVQGERIRRMVRIDAGSGPSQCGAPGCPGTCGTFNVSESLICRTIAGTGQCGCATPPLTVEFAPVALAPGDEITVILYPAPGSQPEGDTSDDQGRLTFGSWNRQLRGLSVTPARGGGGNFDISVVRAFELFGIASVPVDVGSILELRVNETPRGTHTSPDDLIWDLKDGFVEPSGCITPVPPITLDGDSLCSTCDPPCSPTCASSTCTTESFVATFPSEPLQPGDEITVILRPAAGSLPELNNADDVVSTIVTAVLLFSRGADRLLHLEPVVPTPAGGVFRVSFTLPAAGAAKLELLDISGRRVFTRELGALGAGRHSVDVDTETALEAGAYVVRLTQGSRSASTMAVIAR